MTGHDQVTVPSAGPPYKSGEPRSRVFVAIVAVVALALAALGLTQCGWVQKARLDREVDRLCAIDGGVHIYETVTLSKENFGPDGEVFPQFRSRVVSGGALGPDYKWQSEARTIVAGNPSLVRREQAIRQVSDGKLLARQVNYVRGGGDLPGPAAPSSYQCKNTSIDMTKQVFVKEEPK